MFIYLLTIFILSAFLGFLLVRNVIPTLHSPLMSVTNAISGIVILGAIGLAVNSQNNLVLGLSLLAIFFATINFVGGFMVSKRMLQFFKKRKN